MSANFSKLIAKKQKFSKILENPHIGNNVNDMEKPTSHTENIDNHITKPTILQPNYTFPNDHSARSNSD